MTGWRRRLSLRFKCILRFGESDDGIDTGDDDEGTHIGQEPIIVQVVSRHFFVQIHDLAVAIFEGGKKCDKDVKHEKEVDCDVDRSDVRASHGKLGQIPWHDYGNVDDKE